MLPHIPAHGRSPLRGVNGSFVCLSVCLFACFLLVCLFVRPFAERWEPVPRKRMVDHCRSFARVWLFGCLFVCWFVCLFVDGVFVCLRLFVFLSAG
jgi:hypothetical protein